MEEQTLSADLHFPEAWFYRVIFLIPFKLNI